MTPAPEHPHRHVASAVVPWVLRTAQLGSHGLSEAQTCWGGTVAGVPAPGARPEALPADADARIAATALRLAPGCVVGGWAAARVHERAAHRDDLTLFTGELWHGAQDQRLVRASSSARVLVCAPRSARLRPGDHARIFRSTVPATDRAVVDGIPVTAAVRTAFDLARLWSPPAAVAAVDRLLHLGVVDLAEVRAMALARHRWRGRPSAIQVLERVDAGAESPQESALRLLWLDAGLPRPRCNPVIRDAHGAFVARVDLLDPDVGVVGEYDDPHRSTAARRAGAPHREDDLRRQRSLDELGLVVVRATAADLATEPGSAAWQRRLKRAYRSRRTSHGTPRWQVTDE